MGTVAADRGVRGAMQRGGTRVVIALLAVLTVAGCTVVAFSQVEVTDDAVRATRTCGSAFDTVVDRTGWEVWWASDLDEPDDAVRAALVRTERCPGAVNVRIAGAAALGGLAVGLAVLGRRRRPDDGRVLDDSGSQSARLARIGVATTWTGGLLTVAGIVAVVILVADADSTLFLYTDRVVVGVVGLIVLVPTIALFVIGRVLTVLGTPVDRPGTAGDDEPSTDREPTDV